MKKLTALILALAMCFALAACGAEPEPTPTPMPSAEELAEKYASAITAARSEDDNEFTPVVTDPAELADYNWQLLGFAAEDAYAFAIAQSLMNIKAYCVALIMPAEGKAEAVLNGLQSYVDSTEQSFSTYLPDQHEISQNAILETLDDGSILLVMSPEWDSVHDGIVSALEA